MALAEGELIEQIEELGELMGGGCTRPRNVDAGVMDSEVTSTATSDASTFSSNTGFIHRISTIIITIIFSGAAELP